MAGLLLRVAWLLYVAGASTPATPVKVGQTFMTAGLDPTAGSAPWALVSHGIAEKLFTVNKKGEVVGQLAQSVTKGNDAKTWTVTLVSGYKFSDGTAVTADDVVTALTTQNTQNSNGDDALGTMTVTKVDATTVQIVSTMAHPAMDAALANWVFVIFKKNGNDYVYTGPFKVQSFTSTKIELIPNTHYTRGVSSSLRPSITLTKYSNGNVLANALKNGEVDLAFHLPTTQLTAVQAVDGVTTKSFNVGYQYMMFHNMRSGKALSDVKVRKAVDRVINRAALATELKGGSGTRSLFPSDSPYFQADTLATTADKSAAETLLVEAGWTDVNGIRTKGGQQLELSLISYPFRPGLGIMAPLIKTDLESLGIKVNAQDVDLWSSPHDQILAQHTYDLLMWAQHTLPNGDPQWFLNAFFRGNPMASNNFAAVNKADIDTKLDALATAGHANNARINAVSAAHSSILDEVAVSNLVTPQWHIGLSTRLHCYDPWGSDYYVIRADFQDCPPPGTPASASDAMRAGLVGLLLSLASLLISA